MKQVQPGKYDNLACFLLSNNNFCNFFGYNYFYNNSVHRYSVHQKTLHYKSWVKDSCHQPTFNFTIVDINSNKQTKISFPTKDFLLYSSFNEVISPFLYARTYLDS